MYVVLMAMLALNVSTEVLNGFSVVEESLTRTTKGSIKENQLVYDNLDMQMRLNPAKVGEWYKKAQEVKRMSDSLYNFAEELKLAIVQEADGILRTGRILRLRTRSCWLQERARDVNYSMLSSRSVDVSSE